MIDHTVTKLLEAKLARLASLGIYQRELKCFKKRIRIIAAS